MAQDGVYNELYLEIDIGKKDLRNYLKRKRKSLWLDSALRKLVWVFSATAVAVPVPWVCGAERFQWVSPARASLGRSAPAWQLVVLAASYCRRKVENGPTCQFWGNPEQVQGWSAQTQQPLKACFCTGTELPANRVLWKWAMRNHGCSHRSHDRKKVPA